MKKNLRYVYIAACLALLVISLFQIGRHYMDYSKGQSTYRQAEESFGISEAPARLLPPAQTEPVTESETTVEETDPLLLSAADYFVHSDFKQLQETNSEILAWIVIPEPEISYPVVKGTDNQYYLEHAFDKSYSRVGSIFMDYRIENPFEEKNTVLYGHHMRDKSMFAKLMNYQTRDTWETNPYVYICTPDRIYVYEIYAAFKGDPRGLSYHIGMTSEQDIQEYVDYTLAQAYYDTGIKPTTEDSFLTLSTCTGNGHAQRMIVHAKLYGSIARK